MHWYLGLKRLRTTTGALSVDLALGDTAIAENVFQRLENARCDIGTGQGFHAGHHGVAVKENRVSVCAANVDADSHGASLLPRGGMDRATCSMMR